MATVAAVCPEHIPNITLNYINPKYPKPHTFNITLRLPAQVSNSDRAAVPAGMHAMCALDNRTTFKLPIS